jgi:choline dehydrogenase-like flavoprotein
MAIYHLDGSAPVNVEADLCIIGAGPAGISIARTFIGTSMSVCIVESGGLTAEQVNQELYQGTSVGSPEFDPTISRMRMFGGTGKLWGGGCIPLSTLDLGQRDWVPHSGWPLSYAELEPYYARARTFCRIESHDFANGSFLTRPSRPPVPFDASKLVNQIFVSNPVRFGETYGPELEQAANVKVLLHANLLELQASPCGSFVRHARIRSLDGRDGVVHARHFVLACGGIENARLLLLSNSVVPHGLGNDKDLVGRFFMDHPTGKLGTLIADTTHRLTQPYDRSRGNVFPEICLSDEAVGAHRLLSGRIRPVAVEGRVPSGIQALRGLRAAWRPAVQDEGVALQEQLWAAMKYTPNPNATVGAPKGVGRLALQLGLGVGDIARALGQKLVGKPTVKSDHVDLMGYFEQAPNPDSRVTLGNKLDALGQRKICVDWRLTALDWHTYRTAATIFGSELARVCGGQFQLEPWLSEGDGAVPLVSGTAHHLGTTRMSDDPHKGVVDRQCRVHGLDNLYVAGSSVFPTGGWAFPTFSIVALSLRLAEHLRARMAT